VKILYKIFNPGFVQRSSEFLRLPAAFVSWLLFVFGFYIVWFNSPDDYQHGPLIRIMYVHVPSSWMALFVFCSMAFLSFVGLVGKLPAAHVLTRSLMPIGLGFATISLVTGALWGKPAWGAWWVWDARLTSMAILWLQYWGAIALHKGYRDPWRADKVSAIFVLIGAFNLPIIKWSVNWWSTLHQPASIMKLSSPTVHPSFLYPLFLIACACVVFCIWFVCTVFPKKMTVYKHGELYGKS
jgi:heme exporter protein C